jgi:hypothetical protein
VGLTWSEHIDAVLKKLRPMVFAIKRSRYILDDKQLWSLYHVHTVSHVCYLNPVWNCASHERCRPLFVLMNKTIKVLKRLRYDLPTSDLYGREILPYYKLSRHVANVYVDTSRTNVDRQSMLPDGLIRFKISRERFVIVEQNLNRTLKGII